MNLAFVLVEPKVPENVGAAARALKTMGHHQLWLVGSDLHRHEAAGWVAHGSGDILENVRCFDTLEDVREAADLLVGTTAKPRHGLQDWHPPQVLQHALIDKGASVGTIAIVFGREDRGLSNEELARCHLLTGVPLAAPYPSLNLAQAVMLYAWELRDLPMHPSPAQTRDTHSWRALHDRLLNLLPQLGAGDDDKLAGWLHERLGLISQRDVNFLHTLAGDLERTLEQHARSR